MLGLDSNILVQLAFDDHPAHERTRVAVEGELRAGTALVIPALVATEFLHVATDSRRFDPPLMMTQAVHWLNRMLSSRKLALIEQSETSLHQTLRWMQEFNLGRKRILDTHLAAVLYCGGVRRLLTSNPGDFTIFNVLEVQTP